MPSSLFGSRQSPQQFPNPQPLSSNPIELFGQVQNLARQLNGQDPEQVARQIAKERGLNDSQLNELMKNAQNVAGIFGNLGLRL